MVNFFWTPLSQYQTANDMEPLGWCSNREAVGRIDQDRFPARWRRKISYFDVGKHARYPHYLVSGGIRSNRIPAFQGYCKQPRPGLSALALHK